MTTMTLDSNAVANVKQADAYIKQLHECFMEFKVEIRGKSFVKKSVEMVNNNAATFKASSTSLTGSKKLGVSKFLRDVKNSEQAIRNFVRVNTAKLGDYEIISPTRFLQIKQDFNRLVETHNKNIEALVANWDAIKENDKKPAPHGLGDLYNESDYPSAKEVRDSHSLIWIVKPLPDMSRLKIKGLDQDESAELFSKLNGSIMSDYKGMFADLLNKLIFGKNPDSNNVIIDGEEIKLGNGLYYALYRIKNFDENNSFKQNTIDNVTQICDIVQQLNALNDPNINAICDKLRNLFKKDADSLRSNDEEREEFVENAQDALDEIQDAMNAFIS